MKQKNENSFVTIDIYHEIKQHLCRILYQPHYIRRYTATHKLKICINKTLELTH